MKAPVFTAVDNTLSYELTEYTVLGIETVYGTIMLMESEWVVLMELVKVLVRASWLKALKVWCRGNISWKLSR